MNLFWTKRTLRAGFACLTFIAATTLHAEAPRLEVLSTRDPQGPAVVAANSDSMVCGLSDDGRYVLFVSGATSLTTNRCSGGYLNVFLRDRTAGTTVLVSANPNGEGGNGSSYGAVMSADARYVAFASDASDLVPGDTNCMTDIFLRDLQTGITTLVSAGVNGNTANGISSNPVMTPDGRYVAFVSAASNLVNADTNQIADVFVRDLTTSTTLLASVGAESNPATNSDPASVSMSSDGRYVAFSSAAFFRSIGATNPLGDVFVADLQQGIVSCASSQAASLVKPVFGSAKVGSSQPAMSDDGRYVAFRTLPVGNANAVILYADIYGSTQVVHTNASALGDTFGPLISTDGNTVVFVATDGKATLSKSAVWAWNAQSGASTLVSANLSNAVSVSAASDTPVLSASGQQVAFVSDASDLVTNTGIYGSHIYVRDLPSATTTLVDVNADGTVSESLDTVIPYVSGNGTTVAFDSPDRVSMPQDRNRSYDVFVRDLGNPGIELASISVRTNLVQTAPGSSSISFMPMSRDGNRIVFVSEARNFQSVDSDRRTDVFVRDMAKNTNILVSVGLDGMAASGGACKRPMISADGRYVVFTSYGTNLVADDINGMPDVFRRDIDSGITELVSANTAGKAANGASKNAVINADGRYVAFLSTATDLTSTAPLGRYGVYWRDMQAGKTVMLNADSQDFVDNFAISPDGRYLAYVIRMMVKVSDMFNLSNTTPIIQIRMSCVDTEGALCFNPNGGSLVCVGNPYTAPAIHLIDLATKADQVICQKARDGVRPSQFSADGRYFTFSSITNILAVDTNKFSDIYVYDCVQKTTGLVSRDWQGTRSGSANSDSPSISADGRWIVFKSAATNLVQNDTNLQSDIFLFDRITETCQSVSVNTRGDQSGNHLSSDPLINRDGSLIAFQSWASDLIDNDWNERRDVFLAHLAGSGPEWDLRADAGGEDFVLSWNAVADKNYKVQFKDDLSDAQWTDLSGTPSVNGSRASLSEKRKQGTRCRFYRVVQMP